MVGCLNSREEGGDSLEAMLLPGQSPVPQSALEVALVLAQLWSWLKQLPVQPGEH